MRTAPVARTVVVLGACALIAGCSSNNKGKIEGTAWSCRDQLVNGKHVAGGSREIEFKADGGLVMVENGTRYTGTYSLGRGDRVTLHFDQSYEGGKKHARTVQIDGDELQLTDQFGATVKFKKVSGPPPKK